MLRGLGWDGRGPRTAPMLRGLGWDHPIPQSLKKPGPVCKASSPNFVLLPVREEFMNKVALLGYLVLFVAGQVLAQEQKMAGDCAKCDITVSPMIHVHIDNTVCPGAKAVVCEYQYDQKFASKCFGKEGDIEDCKPVVNQVVLPTTKFPANTCGVDNGPTYTCNAPANAGAGPNINRASHECAGKKWDNPSVFVSSSGQYALNIVAAEGAAGVAQGNRVDLGDVRIEIPSAMLLAHARQMEGKNGQVVFQLEVAPLEPAPTVFSFSDQSFRPIPVDDHVQIELAQVHQGKLLFRLAVPERSLTAFHDFTVSLKGAMLTRSERRVAAEKPEGKSSNSEPQGKSKDRDNNNDKDRDQEHQNQTLALVASIETTGKTLASGSQTIALCQRPPNRRLKE